MNVYDAIEDYFKKGRQYYGVFPYIMDIEQGRDVASRLIRQYQSKTANGKLNKTIIEQIRTALQSELSCTERDSQYYLVLAFGKKTGIKVTNVLKWGYLDKVVDLTRDYLTSVYTEAFKWQKRKGQGVLDTRQPKGLFGYVGEFYRVSENGVVQSNKGDEYWSNLTGTVGQKKNNIHFSNVDGIDHLFLTREELVAALFKDDVKEENLYLHIKDPSKGVKATNLEFTKEKKNSKGRTRLAIYKQTGYLIDKVKGHTIDIQSIKETVARKQTDSWLRNLKNKYKTTTQDYIIAKVEGGYHLLTKQKYANLPKGTNKKVILAIEDLINNKGTLAINQANFNLVINQRIA